MCLRSAAQEAECYRPVCDIGNEQCSPGCRAKTRQDKVLLRHDQYHSLIDCGKAQLKLVIAVCGGDEAVFATCHSRMLNRFRMIFSVHLGVPA